MFDRLAAQIWSLSNGLNYPEFLESVIPREWTDSNLQAINQDYACFELWNPSKGFKPRVAPRSWLPTNHKACQKFLNARTQTLWKSNRLRCAETVLSRQWDKTEGSNVPVQPKWPVKWASLALIEVGEVKQNLKGIDAQTACSPDGQKLEVLKQVPVRELTLLLNKWVYAGTLLTKLWEGRTTLVSKEAGTKDPAKFWPISVSSLLVRLYHRILAQRLDQLCPSSKRQKGFCPGNGIAENTTLLQEIIRRATDSAQPSKLYLVFLDMKKAFDSVSCESLILALRCAGLPKLLLAL